VTPIRFPVNRFRCEVSSAWPGSVVAERGGDAEQHHAAQPVVEDVVVAHDVVVAAPDPHPPPDGCLEARATMRAGRSLMGFTHSRSWYSSKRFQLLL